MEGGVGSKGVLVVMVEEFSGKEVFGGVGGSGVGEGRLAPLSGEGRGGGVPREGEANAEYGFSGGREEDVDCVSEFVEVGLEGEPVCQILGIEPCEGVVEVG